MPLRSTCTSLVSCVPCSVLCVNFNDRAASACAAWHGPLRSLLKSSFWRALSAPATARRFECTATCSFTPTHNRPSSSAHPCPCAMPRARSEHCAWTLRNGLPRLGHLLRSAYLVTVSQHVAVGGLVCRVQLLLALLHLEVRRAALLGNVVRMKASRAHAV
jgi:hypothetical protein